MFSRRKLVGAAVGSGALLVGLVGVAGTAQAAVQNPAAHEAATYGRSADGQAAHEYTVQSAVTAAQLPAWYHTPLTAAQVRSEIAIPGRPTKVKGRVRLTRADYTNDQGALAVAASQASGHVLIAGESIQLSGVGMFGYGSATLTAAGRAELSGLSDAFTYVTGATCEGYTDYASLGSAADVLLGSERANSVCMAIMGDDLNLSTTSSIGYGEGRPAVVGGTTHAQRAANRRVVVNITASSVTAPSPPTVAVASAVDKTAVLDLTPAAGPLAVTAYEYSLDVGKTWLTLATTATSPVTGTISGLVDGTTYHVLVRDLTAAGISLPTAALTVTPAAG